ncbi:ATPase domain-containing protein [[Eubacterium] cellulosolvens]
MNGADSVSSGSPFLNRILKKGFPVNSISLIYGEASTGKTTLVMQSSFEAVKENFKVLYIDSDHSFSLNRLIQITGSDLRKIGERIVIFSPKDFNEQSKLIENLEKYITKKVILIVLDGITTLYRESLGPKKSVFPLNRELNRQLAYLAELAINYKLAVLVTSQIHSVFNGDNWSTEPVANRILFHWAKVILSLKLTPKSNIKKAILERNLKTNDKKEICFFTITNNGLEFIDQFNT